MTDYIKLGFGTKGEYNRAAQVYGGLLMERGHVNEYLPEMYVLKEDEIELKRRLQQEGIAFSELVESE